jgi:hypothetical protein
VGRKEKEKAIRSRFVAKIEKAPTGLEKRIAEGKLKDRFKMERNLDCIQASHPQVADLYEMSVKDTKNGARLDWQQKPEQHSTRQKTSCSITACRAQRCERTENLQHTRAGSY